MTQNTTKKQETKGVAKDPRKIYLKNVKVVFANLVDEGFGRSITIDAWERRTNLVERVQIGYGSFFILHQGSFQLESLAGRTGTERFSGISSNNGSSHGIELSLTVTL